MSDAPKPYCAAGLVITTVREGCATIHGISFKTFDDARYALLLLETAITNRHAFTRISHPDGETAIYNPQEVTSITIRDRLEADAARIADAPYEKWVEEQIDQAAQGDFTLGIGR